MPNNSIWSFAVIAALVTTAGTLFGHYLKEVVLARSLEDWKHRRTLREVYRKYRDPIVLAAIELASRLKEIVEEYPTDFLDSCLLDGSAPLPSHDSIRNAYFQRYKCQSTVYRLAAFLGWVELYRQELVFLDPEGDEAVELIEPKLHAIRGDLADGHLNEADNWSAWADALIFREEQRAIGEAMIVTVGVTRTIMGYGTFITAAENESHPASRWIRVLSNFFTDPKREREFRCVRYKRLVVHLAGLIDALDSRRLPTWLAKTARYHREALHLDSQGP